MKINVITLAVLALPAFAAPAVAHHSFAMFESTKAITLEGRVKEFEWTNPHSWIHLTVVDISGKAVNWSIEMGSPSENARRGWKADSVKAGDKLSVTFHPLKDGGRGGQFMSVVLSDGHTLAEPAGPPGVAP